MALTYIKVNMKGTSATVGDTTELKEWDPTTALTDPGAPQPWASWPFDFPPPGNDNITEAVVEAPPAADDSPGSELKWNTKVVSIKVLEDGTSGATAKTNAATITQANGSGLTVNLTAAGGKVTGMTVGNSAGTGYQMGDTVAVSTAVAGTSASVIGVVTQVSQ